MRKQWVFALDFSILCRKIIMLVYKWCVNDPYFPIKSQARSIVFLSFVESSHKKYFQIICKNWQIGQHNVRKNSSLVFFESDANDPLNIILFDQWAKNPKSHTFCLDQRVKSSRLVIKLFQNQHKGGVLLVWRVWKQ